MVQLLRYKDAKAQMLFLAARMIQSRWRSRQGQPVAIRVKYRIIFFQSRAQWRHAMSVVEESRHEDTSNLKCMFAELCFFRQAMQRQMDGVDQRLRVLGSAPGAEQDPQIPGNKVKLAPLAAEGSTAQLAPLAAADVSAQEMLLSTQQLLTQQLAQFQADFVGALERRGTTNKKGVEDAANEPDAAVSTPVFTKLQELVSMYRDNLLDADEFHRLKREVLSSFNP